MVKIMEVKIVVATHKQYRMPNDAMYIPLCVGAKGRNDDCFGYVKDRDGDNISELNPSFCELTGLYWAWKNVDADYVGLVHYRRHFSIKKCSNDPFDNIMTYDQIKPYLGNIKLFVPQKRYYVIETLYSHYKHTHYSEHLDLTREVLMDIYPSYVNTFDSVMKKTNGYMFNMMIMEKPLLNEYCGWLYTILFELKKRVQNTELSSFQGRFYGRVSELIFNVWVQYQIENGKIEKSQIKEIPCIYVEKIDMKRKIKCFLQAKFLGKKYESSF